MPVLVKRMETNLKIDDFFFKYVLPLLRCKFIRFFDFYVLFIENVVFILKTKIVFFAAVIINE